MVDLAEMMLDGTLCNTCGAFMQEEPEGFPQDCEDCAISAEEE